MTATTQQQPVLRPIQYGLLRLIDDEPGMTFAQLRSEVSGVDHDVLRADLIVLAEQRMIAATHFRFEGLRPPLRYYTTPMGVMLLRQFERESLPKPEQASAWQVAARFGIVLFLLCVLAFSSCG